MPNGERWKMIASVCADIVGSFISEAVIIMSAGETSVPHFKITVEHYINTLHIGTDNIFGCLLWRDIDCVAVCEYIARGVRP